MSWLLAFHSSFGCPSSPGSLVVEVETSRLDFVKWCSKAQRSKFKEQSRAKWALLLYYQDCEGASFIMFYHVLSCFITAYTQKNTLIYFNTQYRWMEYVWFTDIYCTGMAHTWQNKWAFAWNPLTTSTRLAKRCRKPCDLFCLLLAPIVPSIFLQ